MSFRGKWLIFSHRDIYCHSTCLSTIYLYYFLVNIKCCWNLCKPICRYTFFLLATRWKIYNNNRHKISTSPHLLYLLLIIHEENRIKRQIKTHRGNICHMNGTTLWQTISFYVWIKCFIMTLNMHLYVISTGWYTKTIFRTWLRLFYI